MDVQEINQRFGFHRATIEGPYATQPRHVMMRRAFMAFTKDLNTVLPDGRYKDLMFDELERASMWAHKAIAQNAPLDPDANVETVTEDTMHKVYGALLETGMNGTEASEAIAQMQNAGILFREFVASKE